MCFKDFGDLQIQTEFVEAFFLTFSICQSETREFMQLFISLLGLYINIYI